MAYGIMKKLFEENGIDKVEIRTAGVMTIPGLLPTQESRQILMKDNMDIGNHRSCKMSPDLLKRANLILGMTSFHVQMALRMSEDAREKTFLLKEYVGVDTKNSQIQDPMGCTLEVYKKVYREVRRACKRLVKLDLVTPKPPASAAKKRAAAAKKAAKAAKPAPAKTAPAKAKKTSPKKPSAKKTSPKKPAPKKPAPKKPAPKKPTAKKPTAKKPAAKKTAPKKPAAKKPTAKKKTASPKASKSKGKTKK